MGGRLPYEPVIEALRLRLEQENAPEDLLEDVWLAELSQLIPELRGRYPDLPSPPTGDASFVRSRLFAAVATLGSVLAKRRPVVFVLDDLQWADVDTRDMIHYAARRWADGRAPILLVLIVRQENYAADASLRDWLTQAGASYPREAPAVGFAQWNGRAAADCQSGKLAAMVRIRARRQTPFVPCQILQRRHLPTGSGPKQTACPSSLRRCCKCWSSRES